MILQPHKLLRGVSRCGSCGCRCAINWRHVRDPAATCVRMMDQQALRANTSTLAKHTYPSGSLTCCLQSSLITQIRDMVGICFLASCVKCVKVCFSSLLSHVIAEESVSFNCLPSSTLTADTGAPPPAVTTPGIQAEQMNGMEHSGF